MLDREELVKKKKNKKQKKKTNKSRPPREQDELAKRIPLHHVESEEWSV